MPPSTSSTTARYLPLYSAAATHQRARNMVQAHLTLHRPHVTLIFLMLWLTLSAASAMNRNARHTLDRISTRNSLCSRMSCGWSKVWHRGLQDRSMQYLSLQNHGLQHHRLTAASWLAGSQVACRIVACRIPSGLQHHGLRTTGHLQDLGCKTSVCEIAVCGPALCQLAIGKT